MSSRSPSPAPPTVHCLVLAMLLVAGCASQSQYAPPPADAPGDWTSWRSSSELVDPRALSPAAPPPEWWHGFHDPVLDALVDRALAASPDLQSATLRLAQARLQRNAVATQAWPEVNGRASAMRNRQSEHGAGTRLLEAIPGLNPDPVIQFLSQPFTLYQAGFDASWELDLWGRVARSIEAADADVRNQEALHQLASLSLVTELVRSYFELREVQREIALAQQDLHAMDERLQLIGARVDAGVIPHIDLSRQRAEAAGVKAQLPALLAREGAATNQLLELLDGRPGELHDELRPRADALTAPLPDLSLGLPSEVALRRPDVRAAEARLHAATARVGVARADLYPSIRIGASFGLESLRSGDLLDWASRTWSIGPSLSLPLFDGGRRKTVVELRGLEQQQAAIEYRKTVLTAWREIDDALSGYEADRRQVAELEERVRSAADAYDLVHARYQSGVIDFINVLDAQRSRIQASRELAAAQARARTRYAQVNKAIGNVAVR